MTPQRTNEFTIRNLMGAAFEAGVKQDVIDAAEKALEALLEQVENLDRMHAAALEHCDEWRGSYHDAKDREELAEKTAPRYCTGTGKSWRDRTFECARELGEALGLPKGNAYLWEDKLRLVRTLRQKELELSRPDTSADVWGPGLHTAHVNHTTHVTPTEGRAIDALRKLHPEAGNGELLAVVRALDVCALEYALRAGAIRRWSLNR